MFSNYAYNISVYHLFVPSCVIHNLYAMLSCRIYPTIYIPTRAIQIDNPFVCAAPYIQGMNNK